MDEVLEVTIAELRKVELNGLEPAELARAKSQLQGNMLLGMESTDSRMNRLARNEIYFRRDVPLDELSQESKPSPTTTSSSWHRVGSNPTNSRWSC